MQRRLPHNLNLEETAKDTDLRKKLISQIRSATIRHDGAPSAEVTRELQALTAKLLNAEKGRAAAEYRRFQLTTQRGLPLDSEKLRQHLFGKTILITGGTGCIGSVLVEELMKFNPKSIVNISRGSTVLENKLPDTVKNFHIDLCDQNDVRKVFQLVKPDIIFHLAAQRNPSQAELSIDDTFSTNMLGTYNILEAMRKHHCLMVYASSSAAISPGGQNIYALSKKICEWLISKYAQAEDSRYVAVRYVHIVDNSLLYKNLKNWTASDSPVRLYGSGTLYTQSALEAAHLLLNASMETKDRELTIQIVKELGQPIDLIDLALGMIAESGSNAPIYFASFQKNRIDNAIKTNHPLVTEAEALRLYPSAVCPEVECFSFMSSKRQLRSETEDAIKRLSNKRVANLIKGLIE